MIRTDVLVVGGGPAGSTLAWALGRRGLDVTVLDRATFPRDKVCAGWITPQVVETLELDLVEYAQRHVLQPIHSFRVGTIGGAEIETRPSAAPLSYGIRRCEFDHHLLARSGARLRLGEPLREMRREGAAWKINDEIEARLVVGAGGHFCPVARTLAGPTASRETVVVAQEIEFRLDQRQRETCAAQGDVPRLAFCPDLRGYGWVFRKGDWINVGLGREDPRRLSDHVAAYREALIRDGTLPADAPARFHGHAYLLYGRSSRPVHGSGLLLVGDAAGLAYPQSGEGIRPAVESGLLAAGVIAEARGDYRPERLAAFARRLERRFGPPPARHSAVAGAIPPALQRALARGLLAREWFARAVVLDRWFLHRSQPALPAGVH